MVNVDRCYDHSRSAIGVLTILEYLKGQCTFRAPGSKDVANFYSVSFSLLQSLSLDCTLARLLIIC